MRPQIPAVRLILKSGQGDPAEVTKHRLTNPGPPPAPSPAGFYAGCRSRHFDHPWGIVHFKPHAIGAAALEQLADPFPQRLNVPSRGSSRIASAEIACIEVWGSRYDGTCLNANRQPPRSPIKMVRHEKCFTPYSPASGAFLSISQHRPHGGIEIVCICSRQGCRNVSHS